MLAYADEKRNSIYTLRFGQNRNVTVGYAFRYRKKYFYALTIFFIENMIRLLY